MHVGFQGSDVAPVTDTPGAHGVPKHHGQEVALKKIVDELYRRVTSDDRLAAFYENIDMVRLKNQQEKVMMMIFGGDDLIKEMAPSLDLRVLHLRVIATQGLTTDHWQLFVGHLQDTLDSMPEIPEEARRKAMEFIRGTRQMFVPLTAEEKASWNAAHPDNLAV